MTRFQEMRKKTKDAGEGDWAHCYFDNETAMPGREEDVCYQLTTAGSSRVYVMNQEAHKNRMNKEIYEWLLPNLWVCEKEANIKTVIVKARGEACFSKGVDKNIFKRSLLPTGEPMPLAEDQALKDRVLDFTYAQSHMTNLMAFGRKNNAVVMEGEAAGPALSWALRAQFRYATPTTRFHLPQTGEGWYVDAGMVKFLSGFDGSGSLGKFLALTGWELSGADMMHCGLATHFMDDNDDFQHLVDILNTQKFLHYDTGHSLLNTVCSDEWQLSEFSLKPYLQVIDACFFPHDVKLILKALEGYIKKGKFLKNEATIKTLSKENQQEIRKFSKKKRKEIIKKGAFAEKVHAILMKKSHVGMECTSELFRVLTTMPLDNCLQIDMFLAEKMLEYGEFEQGLFSEGEPKFNSKLASNGELLKSVFNRFMKPNQKDSEGKIISNDHLKLNLPWSKIGNETDPYKFSNCGKPKTAADSVHEKSIWETWENTPRTQMAKEYKARTPFTSYTY